MPSEINRIHLLRLIWFIEERFKQPNTNFPINYQKTVNYCKF